MREVIEDEGENDQSAQRHGTRCEGRLHVLFLFVTNWPRPAIFQRETDREENMEQDIDQQKGADNPEQGAELAEMFRVGVDPIGPEKDLEVPEEMANHERDQDHARNRDDHLLADG